MSARLRSILFGLPLCVAASAEPGATCGSHNKAASPSCSADPEEVVLSRDHQLLQVGRGGHHRRAPGDFHCTGMPDVKRQCSPTGCKVLATNMQGKTCDSYCAMDSRTCESAAEERDDTCAVLAVMACNQTWPVTSDLLCECSAQKGLLPAPSEPRSDPSTLTLVWSDEFDTNQLNLSKWTTVTGGGGFGNGELQYYRAPNIWVHSGILTITAKCEEYGGQHYTSAKMNTRGKGDWGPGHRIDVRARLPLGKGTWPAIWLLPSENAYGTWPKSGELDMVETVGCTPNKVYGTVHTQVYNHMLGTEKFGTVVTNITAWHTYSIDWTETKITWYIDDKVYQQYTPDAYTSDKWPYNRNFFLILNIAVGGDWGAYCLPSRYPSCTNPAEFQYHQTMDVDYIRVYAL